MYKKNRLTKTSINVNESTEGETIEAKMRRVMKNNEPITDGAPIIFTERKEGVKAEHNIRTDRFEIAVDAMDKVTKSKIASREERHKPSGEPKNQAPTGNTGGDSVPTTQQ